MILNCLLISLKRIEIGNDCFENVSRFVIDGLNELETIIIGNNCFELNWDIRNGGSYMIMNCDQLREIHIGVGSFYCYESFELKNLPSLISIQLGYAAFGPCHSIVFESENDWMNDKWDLTKLQSITLALEVARGDENTVESNELIMRSMNEYC